MSATLRTERIGKMRAEPDFITVNHRKSLHSSILAGTMEILTQHMQDGVPLP